MSQTQYSFSTDADIPTMINCQMGVMEASDKKYRYWFKRPENITLEQWQEAVLYSKKYALVRMKDLELNQYEENYLHFVIDGACKALGISEHYKRWKT